MKKCSIRKGAVVNFGEVEELKNKVICYQCVGERYLSEMIEADGQTKTCGYCDSEAECISIDELSGHIEAAFEQHFSRTPRDISSLDYALGVEWYREGEDSTLAIQESVNLSDNAASDVQSVLEYEHSDIDMAKAGEECEFDSEACYEPKNPDNGEWHEEWKSFEESLKSKSRFFNPNGFAFLNTVFDRIETMQTYEGRKLVVEAGPNCEINALYRARVFQKQQELQEALKRPELSIGAPPTVLASNGRMNARGVSVFYGATRSSIALAEVRPPAQSQAIIAKFDIIRPLLLLDLSAIDGIKVTGSIFDPVYASSLGQAQFLETLSEQMSKPVMPNDEDTEYLITQMIADFLAEKPENPLDGIIYPSVQAEGDGGNVVLFHKASRVSEVSISDDVEISVNMGYRHEDEYEVDITVTELTPDVIKINEPPETTRNPSRFSVFETVLGGLDGDSRVEALSVDVEEVSVEYIGRVTVSTESYKVTRSRRPKVNFPF